MSKLDRRGFIQALGLGALFPALAGSKLGSTKEVQDLPSDVIDFSDPPEIRPVFSRKDGEFESYTIQVESVEVERIAETISVGHYDGRVGGVPGYISQYIRARFPFSDEHDISAQIQEFMAAEARFVLKAPDATVTVERGIVVSCETYIGSYNHMICTIEIEPAPFTTVNAA